MTAGAPQEPEKRAQLIDALAAGRSKAAAARAVGWTREYVSRLWSRDEALRAEVERRRVEVAVVPEVASPQLAQAARDELGQALAAGALEAVTVLRSIAGTDPAQLDPGPAFARIKAAQALIAAAAGPRGTVTARAVDGAGRSVEVTSPVNAAELEALAARLGL